MEERQICNAYMKVEDPVAVLKFYCYLLKGHDGSHRSVYYGVEGDIEYPLVWDGHSDNIEFIRGESRKDSDLQVKK